MSLYIDLTGFIATLRKTGIERISGELCKQLPPNTAIPIQLYSDRYVSLPVELIQTIGAYFRNSVESAAAEIQRLSKPNTTVPITISPADTVLVPEIFGDNRAALFHRMSATHQLSRCRFLIYDLLPMTHPEYFPSDIPTEIAGYYQIVRQANCCGFISEATRKAYYERLKRTNIDGGVVLPLGCDSLGARSDKPVLNRPLAFSVLGTIEPRKNHELILDAFEPLLRQIDGLSLSFFGKMGWVASDFAQRVRTLASDTHSGFHLHSVPEDDTIRCFIQQSRATIYVSAAEGYGLPPVESLWLGTPVIASATIPSLDGIAGGIHCVEPLNVVNLRRAVLAFLDDEYANQKIQQTLSLKLPTWRSFAEEVFRWCSSN